MGEKDYEDSTRSFEVSATRFQDTKIVTTLRDALEGFEESETDTEEEDDVVELNHGRDSCDLCPCCGAEVTLMEPNYSINLEDFSCVVSCPQCEVTIVIKNALTDRQ